MLSSFRKFSSSIFAKILLGIVVIPFVFWGMGSSFTSGSKNIVLKIDKDKYSIEEFANFIQTNSSANEKINANKINQFIAMFVANKLIKKEVEYFKIELSDDALAKLIKNQTEFQRDGVFSRTEYEKFLIEKNISAVMFENNLLNLEKKKHFLELIGGGVMPSNFLINNSFNRINQKRNVEIINLNKAFENQINFTEKEITDYYKNNKEKFSEIYKFIKLIELTPKNLVNSDEFNDIFFKKIDEIDDLTITGKNIDFVMKEYNLKSVETFSINSSGKDLKMNVVNKISKNLVKNIFNKEKNQKTILVEDEDKFFIIEIDKTENILKDLKDQSTRKKIVEKIKLEKKRKLISEIIVKINNNSFTKSDFNKLSVEKNVKIQKISFDNLNDDKILEKGIVSEIYSYGEKKIIALSDLNFEKNFLIYIDSIKNVSIDNNANDYDKYVNLSKVKLTSELFNTYDFYIKNKYKIDINYKALDVVKNYFN